MNNEMYFSRLKTLLSEPLSSVQARERDTLDSQLAASRGQIVLFGAGNLGRTALRCLRTLNIEPLAFCDNNESQWGKFVDGVTVTSPKTAAEKWGRSALFIVTIWSLNHRYADTEKTLKGLGAVNVVCASGLRWKFSDVLMPYFCQDMPHKVLQNSNHILQAAGLWADSKSRDEFLKQIQWRISGDFSVLNPPDAEPSYFPSSIFDLKRNEFFVDCGSYTGDTLQEFLQRTGDNFSGILAVEPDPANLSKLNQWSSRLNSSVRARISIANVALGRERGTVSFAADGTEGSAIRSDGNLTVDCFPLDELLNGTTPTYIKMDIEGAEPGAIAGARSTIEKHRPILSICVYHTQDHVWSIPLLIHQIAPDYRLFLRPHDVDGWQLVCYAVPDDRCKIVEAVD